MTKNKQQRLAAKAEAEAKGTGSPAIDNRRARHEFEILETVDAGLVLQGTEVKSLRRGGGSLAEAYARVRSGEVWLVGMHIAPYDPGRIEPHEPLRPRKLLLHAAEIKRLIAKTQEKGLTIVPLRLFWSRGRAKIALGVARGKKLHDKRESVREREARRELERARR
ncbi:SsrA-binding protein SmpB [bacterium]|nr:MAG: SsrA-binding protein SmpB [bacterium]